MSSRPVFLCFCAMALPEFLLNAWYIFIISPSREYKRYSFRSFHFISSTWVQKAIKLGKWLQEVFSPGFEFGVYMLPSPSIYFIPKFCWGFHFAFEKHSAWSSSFSVASASIPWRKPTIFQIPPVSNLSSRVFPLKVLLAFLTPEDNSWGSSPILRTTQRVIKCSQRKKEMTISRMPQIGLCFWNFSSYGPCCFNNSKNYIANISVLF